MTKRIPQVVFLACAALWLSACGDNKAYQASICVLADISGTYAKERGNMVNIIKAGILPKMLPGDSLSLIAIDSSSYDEKNIKAQLELGYKPSQVNRQKLEFAGALDEFAKDKTRSKYTDISGAMMLCSGQFKQSGAGTRVIMIFSDMKEELKPGLKRSFSDGEFENVDIAAMNVIRLNEDNTNPQVYRTRIEKWEKRVLQHGAKSWNAGLKPTGIADYLESLR